MKLRLPSPPRRLSLPVEGGAVCPWASILAATTKELIK